MSDTSITVIYHDMFLTVLYSSSHLHVACSRHDIDGQLLTWR